ncbi:hypothetical protein [Alloalcanivorax marinus]|uniref:hypothetical protein n=1 Tax=Alloalcanivorax marinus TaxID=1177169 RepID=UPI001958206B|nr:hypothetical protein [Alloalcanivorax marinus]MBM7335223.1 hypothetical protein [Alloalcanivorax marinus]
MSIFRFMKVEADFRSRRVFLVKIISVNQDEILLADGGQINVMASWSEALPFPRDSEGKLSYDDAPGLSNALYCIMRNGRFTGMIVMKGEDGTLMSRSVVTGKEVMGWQGGDLMDYCKKVMRDDVALDSEYLMQL